MGDRDGGIFCEVLAGVKDLVDTLDITAVAHLLGTLAEGGEFDLLVGIALDIRDFHGVIVAHDDNDVGRSRGFFLSCGARPRTQHDERQGCHMTQRAEPETCNFAEIVQASISPF